MQNLYIILISILLAALLFVCIYEFVTRKNMKMRIGKHDNFEHALMNDVLYLVISSFVLLLFFVLYDSGFFTYILKNVPYNKSIIESGLFNGVALVIVGIIINLIYLGAIKCIRHWVVLEELEENEKTWLTIAGCFMLYVVGKRESDFVFSFSAVSLIIAKFFWVINNSLTKLKKDLLEFFHLPIYTIIFIVTIFIVVFVSTIIPKYFLQIIFGLMTGVLVGIIVCAFRYKEKNQ